MLSQAMDGELARACGDELAFLAVRLNRRAGEMQAIDADGREFRDAVLVADFLAREITAAVQTLRTGALRTAARRD
jgi:hypothetical protein